MKIRIYFHPTFSLSFFVLTSGAKQPEIRVGNRRMFLQERIVPVFNIHILFLYNIYQQRGSECLTEI